MSLVRWRRRTLRWRGKSVRWRFREPTGPDVILNGEPAGNVQQPSLRVSHGLAKTSTASFTMLGGTAEVQVPRHGDSVVIRDHGTGVTLFTGSVRNAKVNLADRETWFDSVSVKCVGNDMETRGRVIQTHEGIAIVEAPNGESQFNMLVALMAGHTGATDLGSGAVALRTDLRHKTVAKVLRELAVENDAILSITPEGQIRLFRRSNLPLSSLGRLDNATIQSIGLVGDPRETRSRQIVRYGSVSASRTITGDGSTREFLVAGTQTPIDYMADGVAAHALNADAGDQGLRFRADSQARARSGGGIDFFGGAAARPGSGLYVGSTL